MSKTPKEPRKLKPIQYPIENFDVRPVTEKDKWCYRPTMRNNHPVSPEEWGYVMTIPSITQGRNTILKGIEGYTILRSKKFQGQLLLQIVLTCNPKQYGISSQNREGKSKHNMKKKQHIFSIRNFQKGNFKN